MKDAEIRQLGCVRALKGKCNFPTAFSLVQLISLQSKMLENYPYKHKHMVRFLSVQPQNHHHYHPPIKASTVMLAMLIFIPTDL